MSTLLYLLVIFTFVIVDWYFIEKKEVRLNKQIMWPIRILVTAIFAFVSKDFLWADSLRYLLFLGFYFYLFFDYSLNLFRGKPFFYKGNNFFDRLLPAGLPDIVFKIIFLVSSYIIYQIIFFKALSAGVFESGFLKQFIEYSYLLI